MGIVAVHLHKRNKGGFVSAVFLKAQVRCAFYNQYIHPKQFEAVIDTGAEVSVFPALVAQWFNDRGSPLTKGPPGNIRLADGSPFQNVPSYNIDLILHAAREVDGVARGRKKVDTHELERGHEPPLCFAIPMKGDGHIIIGMDLMRHWRLVLDARMGEFILSIPEKSGG